MTHKEVLEKQSIKVLEEFRFSIDSSLQEHAKTGNGIHIERIEFSSPLPNIESSTMSGQFLNGDKFTILLWKKNA